MIDDNTFPESIDDPRTNIPDLDPTQTSETQLSEKLEDIEPRDPSDSLPTPSEAFEMAPERSKAFVLTVVDIKMGMITLMIAIFMYSFSNADLRSIGAMVVLGLYCFDRAKHRYQRYGSSD